MRFFLRHLVHLLVFIFVSVFLPLCDANELSRCCAGGARHFREVSNCVVKSEGSSATCARAAGICCLRALLDLTCRSGLDEARQRDTCPTPNPNEFTGGIKKECCECCLLARELVDHGQPCVAALGFSPACLNAFNKCCVSHQSNSSDFNSAPEVGILMPSTSIARNHGTCAEAMCECSCRNGYDLAPDGISCVDIDECRILERMQRGGVLEKPPVFGPLCDFHAERCVNTAGGYGCRPHISHKVAINSKPVIARLDSKNFLYAENLGKNDAIRIQQSMERPSNRSGDSDECVTGISCLDQNMQCLNLEGSFSCVCSQGFYWSDAGQACVDIDECLLLVDDCLESQRCLNTPGGYKCIRTQSCGTGYAMDSKTEQCVDVDECNLGAHDCGPNYHCRNTQGSFRCVPKRCGPNEVMDPATGECFQTSCPAGYSFGVNGTCEDVDECRTSAATPPCAPFEECLNTPGGFRCQELGNVCASGYHLERDTGFCVDIDECAEGGGHTCPTRDYCVNLLGTFRCDCSKGYEFNETSRKCIDVDECERFAGHTCSLQARCENTIGSFKCICNTGFRIAEDQRTCEDVDECAEGLAKCAQKCINSPGSYQCICDRGFQLAADGVTCEDIDECIIWDRAGQELCMGKCINVPGSFRCTCPLGYELQSDGITCKDIDECAANACLADHLCVNLLGSFRCQRIECPRNYVLDRNYKNRCVKRVGFCMDFSTERCREQPVHITWQYIAIPRHVKISLHRTSVTLFSMRGPVSENASMLYELLMVYSKPEMAGVSPAKRANFLLQKGDDHNSATISLRDSLSGPQQVHLQLYVENGFSCLKSCRHHGDHLCLSNHTREILYQFSSIPSMKKIIRPIHVAKITSKVSHAFSVDYQINGKRADAFIVEHQTGNTGVLKLISPIRGFLIETIRLNINVKSRRGVVLAHNLAIIVIEVSELYF